MPRAWVDALLAAGAVPASYVPEASLGRTDLEGRVEVRLVEDATLSVRALTDVAPRAPTEVAFLDGVQRWRVVGYGGITPIVRAYVAAAVRRRGGDRRPRTTHEEAREFAITCRDLLTGAQRRALEVPGLEVVDLAAADLGQPVRAELAGGLKVVTKRF